MRGRDPAYCEPGRPCYVAGGLGAPGSFRPVSATADCEMPMSPYVRDLRARLGTRRLLLPSVSAHIFDPSGRLLLVRQRDSGVWSTPGGSIEPDERPSDAVVRETWEETGLLVSPRRLLAVYGGPDFVVRYPSGDEAQYVMSVFECEIVGGTLRSESEETVAASYYFESEALRLDLAPWLRGILSGVYSRDSAFEPPTWTPNHR